MAAENAPQSSLAAYTPTEATVQFRRWTAHGKTAYFAGQKAGFSRREALVLVSRGVAVIVDEAPVMARSVRK